MGGGGLTWDNRWAISSGNVWRCLKATRCRFSNFFQEPKGGFQEPHPSGRKVNCSQHDFRKYEICIGSRVTTVLYDMGLMRENNIVTASIASMCTRSRRVIRQVCVNAYGSDGVELLRRLDEQKGAGIY